MLVDLGGKNYKLVCPSCGGSNIGDSGMGDKYVHCFGHCMVDILKNECGMAEATPDELSTLSQEAY